MTYTADGTAMMFGSEGVASDVQRVEVEGRKGDGGNSGAKSPPSGEGSGDGGEGGAGGGDGGGGDGKVVLGIVVLGGVFAAFLGLKRLLRRRA